MGGGRLVPLPDLCKKVRKSTGFSTVKLEKAAGGFVAFSKNQVIIMAGIDKRRLYPGGCFYLEKDGTHGT